MSVTLQCNFYFSLTLSFPDRLELCSIIIIHLCTLCTCSFIRFSSGFFLFNFSYSVAFYIFTTAFYFFFLFAHGIHLNLYRRCFLFHHYGFFASKFPLFSLSSLLFKKCDANKKKTKYIKCAAVKCISCWAMGILKRTEKLKLKSTHFIR